MVQDKESKLQEIQDQLERGVSEIFIGGKMDAYLAVMAKFHRYSLNNQVMIARQRPDATYVAGYETWKRKFDRHVKRGAQGIKILLPMKYFRETEITLPNGEKDKKKIECVTFRPGYVFDVSDTTGKELPSLVSPLTQSTENYYKLKTVLEAISPVPVEYQPRNQIGSSNGYYSPTRKQIVVCSDLPQLHQIKTLVHELSHAMLHSDPKDKTDRETKEVQAEACAFSVCSYLGLDTSDYSFGYIAGWSTGKEMQELKASLSIIRDATNNILTLMEEKMPEIIREIKTEKDETVVLEDICPPARQGRTYSR